MIYDCIVIGAGPTGAVLAALLGQLGHHVLVLERDAEIYPLPRAVHADHEIMRVLQSLGVVDALAPHMSSVDTYCFQNAAGDVLLEIRGGGQLAVSGFVSSTMFLQPELEAVLRRRLTEMPSVHARLGALVRDLEIDEDVTVTFEQDGVLERARGRYVVGCDGASSFVRRWLAVAVEDLGFDEPWVVVDTQVKGTLSLPASTAYQFCDPRRPTTCVPSGPGRRRWEFMLLPGETREEMGRWENVWPLLEPWGGEETLEPVRLAVYRFHALMVETWREGRVLLAGDAAHQTPPFMGQGLCSGVRDAANLAWKLDLILAGHASERLLDSYQLERAPHFRHVVDTSVAMGRIVCELDPVRAAERDTALLGARRSGASDLGAPRGGQVAPLTAGILRLGDPGAGWLFPQPFGAFRGREARMDDCVGSGALLVVDSPALAAALATIPEAVRVTSVVLDDTGFAELGPPSAKAWLAERGVHAALVRADHYVFGTASDTTGVQRLLADFVTATR
jgi:2-polyprenyl-6-methoxyphenol hydroxylase-like FAD-dependent oxidoreductase